MIGGGENAARYTPLRQDGNLSDDAQGCHRGDFEWLNIRNPQPGMVYYGGLRDRQGKGIRRAASRGWQVVPPNAPEHFGDRIDPNFAAAGLDGYETAGDIIMMSMPEGRYAKLCADREALNNRMRQDNASDFIQSERAMSLQERYGQVHFRSTGHGMQRL